LAADQTSRNGTAAASHLACEPLTERALHDRAIGFHSRFALGADVTQAANIAVQLAQPDLECFVRHVREYDVRSVDVHLRGRCEMRPGMDPDADAYQPSRSVHAHSPPRHPSLSCASARGVLTCDSGSDCRSRSVLSRRY